MPIRQISIPTNDFIGQQVERLTQVLVREMLIIAEKVTNAARSTNSYKDRTGNLRSSLGAIVLVDGQVVSSNGFEVVLDGFEGAKQGREYANELAGQFPEGVVLIVVAGKNYAAHVAKKGYDVLQSAELLADKLVPEMLEKLGLNK